MSPPLYLPVVLALLVSLHQICSGVLIKEPDIPDINQNYFGKERIFDDLLRSVVLSETGQFLNLHTRHELDCAFDSRQVILDIITYDYAIPISRRSRKKRQADQTQQKSESPYFAGDILLTCDQYVELLNNVDPPDAFLDEQELSHVDSQDSELELARKWPTTVHYALDATVAADAGAVAAIQTALDFWTRDTCLEFRRLQRNSRVEDYLVFTKMGSCGAYLGRKGGPQAVHIGPGCDKAGIIGHLIGHSLGFLHEQQRQDRDQQLQIHWETVLQSHLDAFLMTPEKKMHQVPYDMGSIMHTKAHGFSTSDAEESMAPEQSFFGKTMGSRRPGPSFADIKRVNKIYCKDVCSHVRRQPRDGGYWNPKYRNCSISLCPDGYTGNLCHVIQSGSPRLCGGLLLTRETWETFQTPNYPQTFDASQDCNWIVQAPRNEKIELEFIGNTFGFVDSLPCDRNFVEIRTGPHLEATGFRFCGSSRPITNLSSATNRMVVLLRSEDPGFRSRGFRAAFRSTGDGTRGRPLPRQDRTQPDCTDRWPTSRCRSWFLGRGHCRTAGKAQNLCKKTCGFCGRAPPDAQGQPGVPDAASSSAEFGVCRDEFNFCSVYKERNRCGKSMAKKRCALTCGYCQPGPGDSRAEDTSEELSFSIDSGPINLELPPVFNHHPNDPVVYFATGGQSEVPLESDLTEVELACSAEASPKETYRWLKDGAALNLNGLAGRVETPQAKGSLWFRSLTASDEGVYQCIAENRLGAALDRKIQLKRTYLEPFQAGQPERVELRRGEPNRIDCVAPASQPPAKLHWVIRRTGQIASINSSLVSVNEKGSIFFHFFDQQDSLEYACVAENPITKDIQFSRDYILAPKRASGLNSRYKAPPREQYVSNRVVRKVAGDTLQLDCFFSGYPTTPDWLNSLLVTPEWFKDDRGFHQRQSRDGRVQLLNFGKSLQIRNLQREDSGRYECRPKSKPQFRRSFTVNVESRPIWINPEFTTVGPSRPLTEACLAYSNPTPTYTFYQNGRELVSVRNLSINSTSVYQCKAENGNGFIWRNVYPDLGEGSAAFGKKRPTRLMKAENCQGDNCVTRVNTDD